MAAMSRKYRQRGYQDDATTSRASKPEPRPQREGPSGRGLGRPTTIVFRCARCGAAQRVDGAIEVKGECSGCGADLHTCTNCRHFDTSAPKECTADVAQRLAKKSTRNECELFALKQTVESGDQSAPGSDARAKFDALFKF